MLSVLYWKGEFPTRYQFGLNAATLLGSIVGQIAFGIMADRYGRRKVYGLDLVVLIGASLGFATASSGVNNSMSLIAFLIFWRAVSHPSSESTLRLMGLIGIFIDNGLRDWRRLSTICSHSR